MKTSVDQHLLLLIALRSKIKKVLSSLQDLEYGTGQFLSESIPKLAILASNFINLEKDITKSLQSLILEPQHIDLIGVGDSGLVPRVFLRTRLIPELEEFKTCAVQEELSSPFTSTLSDTDLCRHYQDLLYYHDTQYKNLLDAIDDKKRSIPSTPYFMKVDLPPHPRGEGRVAGDFQQQQQQLVLPPKSSQIQNLSKLESLINEKYVLTWSQAKYFHSFQQGISSSGSYDIQVPSMTGIDVPPPVDDQTHIEGALFSSFLGLQDIHERSRNILQKENVHQDCHHKEHPHSYHQFKTFFEKFSSEENSIAVNPGGSNNSSEHYLKNMTSAVPAILWKKIKKFSDLMPIIQALLNSNKVDLAEQLFSFAEGKLGEHVLQTSMSTSLLNMFIMGYLDKSPIDQQTMERTFAWFQKFGKYNLEPDVITYALLLKLSMGVEHDLQNIGFKMLLGEAISNGHTIQTLQQTGIFTGSSKSHFQLLCEKFHHETDKGEEIPDAVEEQKAQAFLSEEVEKNITIEDNKYSLQEYPLPEILPVKQISDNNTSYDIEGAIFVKDSLKSLTANQRLDAYDLQQCLEDDCLYSGKSRESGSQQNLAKIQGFVRTRSYNTLFQRWVLVLSKILHIATADLNRVPSMHMDAVVVLKALSSETIAALALMQFMRIFDYNQVLDGYIYTQLCLRIGQVVEKEIFASLIDSKAFLKDAKLNYKAVHASLGSGKLLQRNMRRAYTSLQEKKDSLTQNWIPDWSTELRVKVGAYLAEIVCKNCRLDVSYFDSGSTTNSTINAESKNSVLEFAFLHELVWDKGKSRGIIRVNPILLKNLSSLPISPVFHPNSMPMVIPPKPWLTYSSGGYLNHKEICFRLKDDPVQMSFVQEACRQGALTPLLTGLDILGKTPWAINSETLSIVISAWNQGLSIDDNMPPPVNMELIRLNYQTKDRSTFDSIEAYKAYADERRRILTNARNNHSLRCSTYYKLEIAKSLAGRPIYFPHNTDFRGRAYPIPALLNHIGDDLSRGLLQFAEAKPLGSQGLRWLKIHLANLYGYDKVSLSEREAWTDLHLVQIQESVIDPLGNDALIWRSAENPWQFLSAARDITAALNTSQPELYMSRIPIHQDGSCNGLQHYAALGRDIEGAIAVNLAPGDQPGDIYSTIANLVKEKLAQELGPDPKYSPPWLSLAHAHINRKIVKQTVMTTVYGVTEFGARAQIRARLNDIPDFENSPDSQRVIREAASRITHYLFASIGDVFNSAKRIQHWLVALSQEISLSVPPNWAAQHGFEKSLDATNILDRLASIYAVLDRAKQNGIPIKSLEQYRSYLVSLSRSTSTTTLVPNIATFKYLRLAYFNPLVKKQRNVSATSTNELLQSSLLTPKENLDSDLYEDALETTSVSNISNSNLPDKISPLLQSSDEFPVKEIEDNLHKKDAYPQTLMFWTSPLGFPIAQPYRQERSVKLMGGQQSISLRLKDDVAPVRYIKQLNAFPPNFIHSLDASHMFLTAAACYEAGLTFASVHDSFWTHACHVPEMNRLLRNSFVQLHQMDILNNLRNEVLERYSTYFIPINVPLELASCSSEDELILYALKHWKFSSPTVNSKYIKEDNLDHVDSNQDGEMGDHFADESPSLNMHEDESVSPSSKSSEDSTKDQPLSSPKKRTCKMWKQVRFPLVPPLGNFPITDVLQSTYFFN